jgi:hypothetical protein
MSAVSFTIEAKRSKRDGAGVVVTGQQPELCVSGFPPPTKGVTASTKGVTASTTFLKWEEAK